MGSFVAGAEVIVVGMEQRVRKESFYVNCHVLDRRKERSNTM
jgi:hypothetical protein